MSSEHEMTKATARQQAMTLAPVTTSSPTQTQGSDGVYAWGGHLVQVEKKPELRGRQLYATFENLILNTSIVGASVRYFQNLIGGTEWTAIARADSPSQDTADRAQQIVEQGLFKANMDLPWSSVVKKAALFKYYGFSIHEWAIRRRADGMIVFGKIEHRPQYTVDMWNIPEDGGGFEGMWQRVPGKPQLFYVPRDRMFYCVDNTLTDSPDGIGLLRHCAEPGRRLDRYQQLEGFGFEGDLRGMPVGRVPGAELMKEAKGKPKGWLEDQMRPMDQLIANHVKSPFMGIVLDSATYSTAQQGSATPTITDVPKWAIDIIKGASSGLSEIHITIERLNREIARVLGMEHILLGGDGKGSQALSQDKTSMFASVLECTLRELAWFAYHDLVYPLLELNGIDPEIYAPDVKPDPIATERIEATVDALYKLSQAGAVMMPDDPAINQIRARLNLADQPEITPELIGAMSRAKSGNDPDVDPDSDVNPDDGVEGANTTDTTDRADAKATKPTKPRATAKKRKSTFRSREM